MDYNSPQKGRDGSFPEAGGGPLQEGRPAEAGWGQTLPTEGWNSSQPTAIGGQGVLSRRHRIAEAVSREEKRQRPMNYLVNGILWLILLILVILTVGAALILFILGWLIALLTAEYQVRRIQAMGVTVSPYQFPRVFVALQRVCDCFGLPNRYRVVVVQSGQMNALAIKFARKRVIVLFSEIAESVMNQPDELAALLAHEVCHHAMDHGIRGIFELYKPAIFRSARELTCDNAGFLVSGNVDSVKSMLRKATVGNALAPLLSDPALEEEAKQINSGLVGWFVRRHLSHPPLGARIRNVREFSDPRA